MSERNDPIRVGDFVRVESGVHEGKSGRVVSIRGEQDALEIGARTLTGLLGEPFALIEYNDNDYPNGVAQVGVPVRRLQSR